ncbi:MAG TPA: NAD-dependent epimerase/dehydratase family protein [Vicinamibacteria bacterium]|nr:NAD-dependent epimerase/dehydratase family protein [Vicinamibacteria bacterium]
MKLLLAGACGFVGSTLARTWAEAGAPHRITGLDSFARPGSETNRLELQRLGVRVLHADVRAAADFEGLPAADFVIDAAAHPSVLAGVDGRLSSRQVVEHNLLGTVNLLEYCRRHGAGLVLLSTSRVYSLPPLARLAVRVVEGAYVPVLEAGAPAGLSAEGVAEGFSTAPPVSLYGATKLASEVLALEYSNAYSFPVWIDRCGLLAGAGQFGRPDQGIFAYWIHSWLRRRPLAYTGFGGSGHQVRDCLHPADLVPLLDRQMAAGATEAPRVVNVGGGRASALSLLQLSRWCRERLGDHAVAAEGGERPFDVPWLVLDAEAARRAWDWAPGRRTADVLEDILRHARAHPSWLEISAAS